MGVLSKTKNYLQAPGKGKTIGVIGLGAIGAKVAMAASNLGMKVIGYDPALSSCGLGSDGNKVSS